jgi:hypothetical protein
MGFRYRKAIKIAPGVKLNLNAHSVSLTGGVPGAHVTLNSKGYRTTSVSAPGTGLSYRTTKRVARPTGAAPVSAAGVFLVVFAIGVWAAIAAGLMLLLVH